MLFIESSAFALYEWPFFFVMVASRWDLSKSIEKTMSFRLWSDDNMHSRLSDDANPIDGVKRVNRTMFFMFRYLNVCAFL